MKHLSHKIKASLLLSLVLCFYTFSLQALCDYEYVIGQLKTDYEAKRYESAQSHIAFIFELFGNMLTAEQWQEKTKQVQNATKQSKDDYTETINGVSFKMIYMEGGSFQMGSKLGGDDEKPVHTVTLTDYHIAEAEVTQKLWRAVMGSDPDSLFNQGCDECPVEGVTWDGIVNEFLPKLNQLTGKQYSLPTEAQWEYAARGGKSSNGYTYSGSKTIDGVAWYGDNFKQSRHGSKGSTHPVKTKIPNELGLYDMTGNVWEWCQDGYDKAFYSSTAAKQTNPVSNTETYRILRGGSWYNDAINCRVAYRSGNTPDNRSSLIGFRLCFIP